MTRGRNGFLISRLNPWGRQGKVRSFHTLCRGRAGALPRAMGRRSGAQADRVLLQISGDEDIDRLAQAVARIKQIPSPYAGAVRAA